MFLLRVFGGASLEDGSGVMIGRAVQRRRLALLAILALEHPRAVPRDKLVAWLWPEHDAERARHLLRDSLYLLRNALGEDTLPSVGDTLRLNPQHLRCDVWDFEEALAQGRPEAAVLTYSGRLLDGFHPGGGPELEHWVDAQRDRLARAYAQALEQLAENASAETDHQAAVGWWRRLAADDPYNARVTLRLMQALDAAGDRAGALQQARIHAVLLEQEFGAGPDPEVDALAERLRTAPIVSARLPGPSRADHHGGAEHSIRHDPQLEAMATPLAAHVGAAPVSGSGDTPTPPAAHVGAAPASASAPAPSPASARRPLRRRAVVLTVAVAAAMGLATVVWAILLVPDTNPRSSAVTSAAAVSPKSIAVLPCLNLSGDPEQEYFSDGLTEELTGVLAGMHSLQVVARTSAFAFKGVDRDIREIGKTLNVGTILECSVRRAGERVRVTAQLINAVDGFHLWTETYEREGTDVFAIQTDLALRIARALEAELTPVERARVARRPTASPEAHALYQKGRYFWNQRTASGYARAIEYYERAIAADPDYAEAYAGLATVYSMQGIFDIITPEEATERTRVNALKALELDPDIAEAHTVLGGYYQAHVWDSEAAEREHLRALELDPNYSTAHFWYGNFLTSMHRFEEAIAHKTMAVELDPLSAQLSWALGITFLVAGRTDEALVHFRNAVELDSLYTPAHAGIGAVFEARGQLEEAARVYQRSDRVGLARALGLLGRKDEARVILQELQADAARTGVYAPWVATVFPAVDDIDGAINWLEHSYRQRHPALRFIGGPGFDLLERDPRFRDLRRRIGLPP
ncbi:MAG TPA: tetratricopeptide repeat protein [Longimicrobiales bacterium]|nr:tetratricopeptide repeat protein [Longimicrobiales bacterium]